MTSAEYRAALKELRLSQINFARRFDIHKATVNEWAKHRDPPGWVAEVIQLLRFEQAQNARNADRIAMWRELAQALPLNGDAR